MVSANVGHSPSSLLSLLDQPIQVKFLFTIQRLGSHLEGVWFIAFDHLQLVAEHLLCPVDRRARVSAGGEDFAGRLEAAKQAHHHGAGTHAVLSPDRVNHSRQQVALRIGSDVTFADLDFLARVVAACPLLLVVLADCESTMATVGVAFRPATRRPFSRSVCPVRCQSPSSRQRRNYSCTAFHGDEFKGS